MSDETKADHDGEPDDTGSKQAATQFKPGQSGNPKGRPKGARNKLGEAFIEDLLEDWQLHGVSAIAAVRGTKPDQYLRVIASILPRELNVRTNDLDELTDEQLARQYAAIVRAIEAVGLSMPGESNEQADGQTIQ